jgi:hypothetical protein
MLMHILFSNQEDDIHVITFGRFGGTFYVMIAQKLAILLMLISIFYHAGREGLFCRQLSQVRKMDFLDYESTQSPIFDLDHGGPIFELGQEKKVIHAQKLDYKNSG